MGDETYDGHGWGIVASAGLDADVTVLDDVDTADTVELANSVKSNEKLKAVGDLLALSGQLDGDTLLEVDLDVLWGGRGLHWVISAAEVSNSVLLRLLASRTLGRMYAPSPHIGWWWLGRVLELTALVRAVGNVVVHAVWLGLGGGDGDASGCGVVEEVVAALEALEEFGHAPWSNDLDLGVDGKESKLEANLVVALSGAAGGGVSGKLSCNSSAGLLVKG